LHTEPQYQLVSRVSSNPSYHEDTYTLTHPDGSKTQITRQVPKRVGKTAKDRRMHD